MSKPTATERLAQLREQEHRAKVASNQAEREALQTRNAAERADDEVVRAHAGHGTLANAEKALADAESGARTAKHKAQGAALHHREVEAELRQFHGSHYAQLVAEATAAAGKPGELMLEGIRQFLEEDALWRAQAQEMDGHLRAAGQPPSANMRDAHELAEVARVLTRFSGEISPPLPHGHGIELQRSNEEAARRWKAERNTSPQAA